MARTEIQLDDVYYKVTRQPSQTLANQMASKVGQGQSQYGDLTTWSAWIQDNWQEGVGNLRPSENGGMLYSELESRVPNQLILPGLIRQVDTRQLGGNSPADCRNMPETADTDTLVDGTTVTRVAIYFITPTISAVEPTCYVWMYLSEVAQGTVLNFEIQTDSGPHLPSGTPSGTVIASGTTTVADDSPTGAWYGANLPWYGTVSDDSGYWLVVYATSGSFRALRDSTSPYAGAGSSKSRGASTWSAVTGDFLYTTQAFRMLGSFATPSGAGFFRFYNTNDDASMLYCYTSDHIYKYDESSDEWDFVGDSGAAGITSAINFPKDVNDGTVWFGNEDNAGWAIMDDDETFDAFVVAMGSGNGVFTSTVFAKYGGYLWQSRNNKVGYGSGDLVNDGFFSTDEMVVGGWEYPVTGMCGMGDSMFVSTSEALYRIAPGDFAVGVLQWDGISEENGRSMVNFDGALYITANKRVVRVTEDLTKQDVWLTREEDLAQGRLGTVMALAIANGWLCALVTGGPNDAKPSVWAYKDSSWHFVALLPDSQAGTTATGLNYNLYYDAPTDHLWIITPQRLTYRLYIPPQAMNPFNDENVLYNYDGWAEWDWFDGPVMEALKDYDSVSIIGEGFSSAKNAEIYWKDDASTTWESLGEFNSDYGEIRWDIDGSTRPNTRRFKLGMALRQLQGGTPRVRAIRVKYHLMVRDWFRWQLNIEVSGRSGAHQLLADGTRHSLSASEIKDNLDALATQVPPFVYKDVDGTEYEVKVISATFQYTAYEYNENTMDEWWAGEYSMVVEQVTQGAYTA